METLFGPDPDFLAKAPGFKCRGHAGEPGSGPKGQTCGTCKHRVTTWAGGKNRYQKCGLMREYWTGGYGTDIRCKDRACLHWKGRA